uniref:Uncharacterized protein n=1 Tax=Oryza barthii TaxID=65489 RepID=A0A0D3FBP6_9ORYZ
MSGHGCHHPISLTSAPLSKSLHHRLRLPPASPFFPFLPSPPPHSSHHHHLSLPVKTSAFPRRSDLFPNPLCHHLTSPDAQRAGTRLAAAVEAVPPPEHQRPILSLLSVFGGKKRRRREEGGGGKEKERLTDPIPPLKIRRLELYAFHGDVRGLLTIGYKARQKPKPKVEVLLPSPYASMRITVGTSLFPRHPQYATQLAFGLCVILAAPPATHGCRSNTSVPLNPHKPPIPSSRYAIC